MVNGYGVIIIISIYLWGTLIIPFLGWNIDGLSENILTNTYISTFHYFLQRYHNTIHNVCSYSFFLLSVLYHGQAIKDCAHILRKDPLTVIFYLTGNLFLFYTLDCLPVPGHKVPVHSHHDLGNHDETTGANRHHLDARSDCVWDCCCCWGGRWYRLCSHCLLKARHLEGTWQQNERKCQYNQETQWSLWNSGI